MAALTHFGKVDATLRTTTATAETEITQYTVAWSDLTTAGFSAGDDVLLICQVGLGGTVTTTINTFDIWAATTFAGRVRITDAHADQVPAFTGTAALHNAFWMERHTLVVNENIYFSFFGAGGTTAVDDFSFIVLRLNDLTENVDYKWAKIDHGVGDAPTTYDTSGASVTIPAANEDWLALAQVRWLIDATATSATFTALQVDGVDRMEVKAIGTATSEDFLIGIVDALVAPANGATIRTRFRTSATSHDAFTSKVFILRLGVFEDYELERSTSTITHSSLDAFATFIDFTTFALTTTGDVGFFAQSRHVFNENTKSPYGRVRVGGADVVSGYRRSNAKSWGATDQASVTAALVAAQTAGTLNIDFGIAEDTDITPNYSATEHSAVVFSFELAPAAAAANPYPYIGGGYYPTEG